MLTGKVHPAVASLSLRETTKVLPWHTHRLCAPVPSLADLFPLHCSSPISFCVIWMTHSGTSAPGLMHLSVLLNSSPHSLPYQFSSLPLLLSFLLTLFLFFFSCIHITISGTICLSYLLSITPTKMPVPVLFTAVFPAPRRVSGT